MYSRALFYFGNYMEESTIVANNCRRIFDCSAFADWLDSSTASARELSLAFYTGLAADGGAENNTGDPSTAEM